MHLVAKIINFLSYVDDELPEMGALLFIVRRLLVRRSHFDGIVENAQDIDVKIQFRYP
jgi:hypothetical protein